jgi:hypothetical protein
MDTIDGYDRLVALIGSNQEAAIFRKFSDLGAKNLLYRQAELLHLEAQLRQAVIEDKASRDAEKEAYQYSVFDLLHSLGKPSKDHQWRTVLELRKKLEEYCELLQLETLLSQPK